KYFLFGFSGIFVFRHWLPQVSDKVKRNLLNVFFVSIIAAGLYAVYNFLSMTEGRVKAFTDTMRYGYGSGMILLVILSAILQKEKTRNWLDPRLALAALVVGFVGMYLTYARGALLGFMCGFPFVLYFYKPKLGLLFGGLSLLAVLTLGGFYLYGSGNHDSRLLMNKNNTSDGMRRSQWKAAVISIKEKPVLGWGLSNFHSQLKRIKEENDLEFKEYNDAHSHNLFLEIGSGTGIIGLLIFIGWVLCWALEVFKSDLLTRALVIPFGVAFVISSQFEVTFDANNASMIFFLYAISVAHYKPSQKSVRHV
ncbi:MAG TPA: O-antigen ligase family protein, partial [Bacteriovoracaceae bacterium]|nr:O-antigen ligase family protein [Bacteriovoracaceae bacterium]